MSLSAEILGCFPPIVLNQEMHTNMLDLVRD